MCRCYKTGNLFIVLSVLICLSGFSQPVTEKGYYLSIRNFTPKDYKSRPQNWDIVEDNRGILYFANNNGILVYDGIFWKNISVKEDENVYSLDIDKNGIIYVGGQDEIGYLQTNSIGEQEYISLLGYLDESKYGFGKVWKTHATDNGVYFKADEYLFKWTGDTIVSWKTVNRFHTSFYLDGNLFIGEENRGLMKMRNDSLILVPGGAKFKNILIKGMITDRESGVLIFTESEGIFHMLLGDESESIKLVRHFNEIDNFMFENFITCAIRVNENQFAIGSQGKGVIIYDQTIDQFDFLNFSSGLQDEVIYNMHLDRRGNLWMALSNGISMSPVGTSVTFFGYNSGIKESVEGICRFRNKLFVATILGTYYLDNYQTSNDIPDIIYNPLYNRPGFRKIEDIVDECYASTCFSNGNENLLLIATYSGISEIDENFNAKQILECYPWFIFQSKKYPERVIIANEDGVESIYRRNGNWIQEPYIEEIEDDCRIVDEDPDGNVWIGTMNTGKAFRISYNKPGIGTEPGITQYDSTHSLPEGDIYIKLFGDKLIFGTSEGIYRFNESENRFYPDTSFGVEFSSKSRSIHRISVDYEGSLWMVTYNNLTKEYETGYFVPANDGNYTWVKEPFLSFSKGVIHSIFHDPNGVSWMGGPDGLFRYDRRIRKDYELDFNALLRNITIKGDSQIFAGTFTDANSFPALNQNPDEIPVIANRYNSIAFEFSAPTNEDGTPVLFNYYLEGFDEGWHEWSTEYRREYTNLRERTYTFHVKARNLYDHESTVNSYTFIIKPPWYRTIPALVSFILGGIGIIWLIFVLYTRGLRAIIRERTAEIRKQKELIEEKNQDIMGSINYAQRIQSALLPPGDYIDTLFPERFILYLPRDVVSGDYYWMIEKKGRIICVTADCTGHGVPGAMMSMMGMSFLNEITSMDDELHSDEILNQLRSQIVAALRQKGVEGESQDGMDMTLYILDSKKRTLEFSGANLPLYLFRNGELQIIQPDKMPIGISSKLNIPFSRNNLNLETGDSLYTFSDGYQDQFGGPKKKKFMIRNLRQLLCDIHTKPMTQQRILLKKCLDEWMGESNCGQVDDITIIGIKIS
jgi:serine phosphatase RsbU (regulator of sigma subunit)